MQVHLMQKHLMPVHLMFMHGMIRGMSEEYAVRAWREVLAKHATAACALERELAERTSSG